MARGQRILVSAEPKGKFQEVIVDGTPKPGTVMTIKPGTAVDGNGHFTYEAAGASAGLMAADGDQIPIAVLLGGADGTTGVPPGRLSTDAYVSGELGTVYFPIAGEELNIVRLDVVGTADDITIGQKLIVDDGTGKVLGTTGTPESEPFVALEALTDPTGTDTLLWCQYTGH